MLPELDTYDWGEAFGEPGTYNQCNPEPEPPHSTVDCTPFTRNDVEIIIAQEEGEHDGANWVGLYLLKDGRYATVEGGCDYTGWD